MKILQFYAETAVQTNKSRIDCDKCEIPCGEN